MSASGSPLDRDIDHTMKPRKPDRQPADRKPARATELRKRGSAKHAARTADRGQSTLDFAIGMSVFLLTLIGVLLFVTATMQPFTSQSQANIGLADRIADSLAEGLLGDPAQPHIVNGTCTAAFFNSTSPNYCRYTGSNLTDRVGVKPRRNLNVTMEANITGTEDAETLCWNETQGTVVEIGTSDCDIPLVVGSTAPQQSGNAVTARRVVTINGTDAILRVEVW